MNSLKKLSFRLLALAALAFSANANATLLAEASYDPSPDILVSVGHPTSHVLDIAADGYVIGTPILSAEIGLQLLVPKSIGKAKTTTSNKFVFYFGSTKQQSYSCTGANCISTQPGGQIFDILLNNAVINELKHTGKLPVTIQATAGSFLFGADALDVTYVPEPATLALLGLGLIGVSAVRRRRA